MDAQYVQCTEQGYLWEYIRIKMAQLFALICDFPQEHSN